MTDQHNEWTQIEARAFNAVLPALRAAGEWLPLTARRAVANAVLTELKRELDALADYENRLTWHTTCEACARILDSSIRETERRERAENALARVRKACDSVRAADQGHNPAVDWVVMRVLEAIDARLVNQSAPVHCPCNGVHFPSPDSCRWCKCHRTGRTAPVPAATEATDTTKEQQ
ncbi:hypothetical protein [Streptomyces antibioticus]|uniref:Uncharacterized protein n=1 Tax=Streptomyces antibioticus TaxID=1890 RepID=A0AAE6YF04_STRAT|nr:hypothetical protein [Streptomyces antibioticus]OOQ47289.1 hypothetical protein AFM16_31605 [Streptomyces antibioticus]QIT47612.1 hypothetical protein HCX60_32155 [Streptomyces antibioticus]